MRQFTAVAGKATEFARLFNATFANGFEGYRVDLTAPVGQSTAGGKQALQHILLVPHDGTPAMVIGGVNQGDLTAELRTFRHLAELHALRFKGARVPVDLNAYRGLTRNLQQFFAQQQLSVVMVDLSETPRSSMPPPVPAPAGGSQTPWIIAGMSVAFALGIGVVAALALNGRGTAPAPAPTAAPSASASAR